MSLVRINRIRPETRNIPFYADQNILWRGLVQTYMASEFVSAGVAHFMESNSSSILTAMHIGTLIFSPPISDLALRMHSLGRIITSFYYLVNDMTNYSKRMSICT